MPIYHLVPAQLCTLCCHIAHSVHARIYPKLLAYAAILKKYHSLTYQCYIKGFRGVCVIQCLLLKSFHKKIGCHRWQGRPHGHAFCLLIELQNECERFDCRLWKYVKSSNIGLSRTLAKRETMSRFTNSLVGANTSPSKDSTNSMKFCTWASVCPAMVLITPPNISIDCMLETQWY